MERTLALLAAALVTVAPAASAQQIPHMLSERPAAGLAVGPASWGGDEHTLGPATDVTVHTVAKNQARSGRASDIGISITSGGTGKNELSTNDTRPISQRA